MGDSLNRVKVDCWNTLCMDNEWNNRSGKHRRSN